MIVFLVLAGTVVVVTLAVLATFVEPTGCRLPRGRRAPAQPRQRGPPTCYRCRRGDTAGATPTANPVLTVNQSRPRDLSPPCPPIFEKELPYEPNFTLSAGDLRRGVRFQPVERSQFPTGVDTSCSTPLRPRPLNRTRRLHYRGPWRLPGPDSHRLVVESLSLATS